MPLIHRLYPLLRPLLFKLDAETAHEWTVKMMRIAHTFGILGTPIHNPKTEVNVLGLNFPNCVGLAAGMDKSASAVDAWFDLGFGFVEVGTLTPRPQPGNPTPRLFRLKEHDAIINRMGFNNPGIDSAIRRLEMRSSDGIVGVNIGKNFDTANDRAAEDYLYCLKVAYPVADYIAINISSPNTKGLRDLQSKEPLVRLIEALKEEQSHLQTLHSRYVPLLVKIAPDLDATQISMLARVFNEQSIDGVIATNTTLSRDLVKSHPQAQQQGGLSGRPLYERSTEVLADIRSALSPNIPIIGVGGIQSVDEAIGKIRAGASLIQLYTGLIYRGPRLVSEISAVGSIS